jgi:cytochrome P450
MNRRPITDVDIYSDEMLDLPYDEFARMRSLGPAVWLDRYDMWAFPRYSQVRAALADWKTFSSGEGVGVEPEFNEIRRGTVIASDPPEHTKLRALFSERLSGRVMRELHENIEARAEKLVDDLAARESFDAVGDFAEVFPVSLVADLIGLPLEERDKLLERSRGSFNAFGPKNKRGLETFHVFEDTKKYISTYGTRDRLTPGSLGASLYEAADRGELEPEQVLPLMFSYLFPSLDTTVSAIGHAVWLLASHPEQWRTLKAEPSLIPAALEEILRLESPVQFFARSLRADYDAEGTQMKAGDRVILMYGSANRDDRKYVHPDRFDIRRNPVDHVAFGAGIHNCVGARLARAEVHALLGALVRRVDRIEAGPPMRRLNNSVRSLGSLPVVVHVGERVASYA